MTNLPDKDLPSLQRQLAEARENLRLIQERKAEFVLSTDVPLQLVKEERRLLDVIAELEQQVAAQPAALEDQREQALPTATGHVFISYAREDQTYARKLADDLRARGFETWMDDRIDFGDRWWQTIVQAIRASAAFIVVMTPDAEQSEWVERELMLALDEGRPVFPLLLRGKCFPILITKQFANVSGGQMPPAPFYERLARVAPARPKAEETPPKPQPPPRVEAARPTAPERRRPFEPEMVLIPAGPSLEAQRAVEAEREVEQLPAEKAERIAVEKPKDELVQLEFLEPIVQIGPVKLAWNWKRLRLPLAVVALLGLVIGGAATGLFGGGEKPTPNPTTSVPVVVAPSITETPTATARPPSPAPTATLEPPTATVPPKPTPTPTLGVGSTIVRDKDGMVMVYVPGGTFEMGSTDYADVQPVHTVTLDGFWIDRTEVTNAQYARCVAAGVCRPPSESGSFSRESYYGDERYNEYPVITVSWNDATTYCQWAGGRLPSEAEWEYAARGPDGHIYPWGNDPPDDTLLNYNGLVGDTTQVGSYPKGQNWAGALDMAGNVYEWVNDWYGRYPSEPQANPSGPASGQERLLRGGSWITAVGGVRAAYRIGGPPDGRLDIVGFRCVVAPGK